MSAPTVSVIMAAYNGAHLIRATIDSLLAQSFTDFEAIIVDDCSTDDTRSVLDQVGDPRIRVIGAPLNGGPVLARNIAFAEAKGRLIAGLDQDDLCRPDRLARQVAYLDAHPDTVLLGAAAKLLHGTTALPALLPPVTTPMLVEWMLDILNPLVWSTVMLRADIARRLDPFTRPELLYAEDFDLYHRMARHGRIARIDEPLLLYRCHAGGVSKRFADAMLASAARVLAERHAETLGDDAHQGAELLARHVLGKQPVPDRATLALLGGLLGTLQRHFLATRQPARDDARMIRWETARLWAAIGRAALRSGSLGLADVLSVRPDHLGLGYAGVHNLALSGLVGLARRTRRISGTAAA